MRSEIGHPTARHYVAGGCEHGGGIGRLVGYVVDNAPARGCHYVTDTRGPRWSVMRSPPVLAVALAEMLVDRVLLPNRVHHLHIAGRGSTARKVILGTVARWTGCRHVVHLHDYDYAGDLIRRPAWQQWMIRRLFRGANHVIVLGRRDRSTVVDLLGVEPARVSILRNCVPDPGSRERDAPRAGAPVGIVFLGQLGTRKGVPELLDALASPVMDSGNWHATLAGDGPVEDYTERAAALGLTSRVSLPGWLGEADARALCAGADILVLPSHGEGFAMAVLEGLAHGLAVVTTRVGAHDEVLKDERSCLFVPVGDARALARALARLVADPALRTRLSEGGRTLFLSQFGIEGYVIRLEDLHRTIARTAAPAWRTV
ncbi:glycosyl transferase [Acuticoccus sediminis]|uniref:Glycosyl transferase n=1 Tax=Acuticoccus sediminis TaxID=2184697 RepID=A0A8B2NP38_9HYPH|nr:glycosyltransferase [Acuticoccus sediminis]RAH98459.1 glycosyl transferase [Acuticoccus sediminis]